MKPNVPIDETTRLEALRRYRILDTEPERVFDDLTRLAAQRCETPIALISLVDADRQWFKSRIGLALQESPRETSFCGRAILQPDVLVVCDALKDERFATSPLVIEEPHIRFYAGAPLQTPDGHALGTLCVIDHVPRKLSAEQVESLRALSRQVVSQLELRRRLAEDAATLVERERAGRRQHAQIEVTRVLAEATAVREAIRRILQIICESLDWDVGGLWEVDREANVLRCTEMWHVPSFEIEEFEGDSRRRTFARGMGLLGRVWASGEPTWVLDVAQDTGFLQVSMARRVGLHSAISFPIAIEQKVISVIECFSRDRRDPDPDLLRMFGVIGDELGQFIERKRAEEALRQSQERLRAMIETEPECVKLVAADGTLLEMNAAGLAMVEADHASAVIGRCVYELIAPECREAFRAFNQQVCRGEKGTLEFEIVGLKGTRRRLETHGVPLRDQAKGTIHQLAITRDVTERKQIEATLRETERRWRTLLERVRLIVIGLDRRGNVNYVNPYLLELTGYTVEEMMGKHWFQQFLPERDRRNLELAFGDILEKEFHRYFQNSILTKSGEERMIEWNNARVRDRDGHVVGTLSIGQDVTDRLRAEKALQESEQRLQAILDNSTAVIYVKDKQCRYVLVNRWFEVLFHVKREQLVGKTDYDLFPRDRADAFRANDLTVLKAGAPLEFEEIAPQDDGLHTYISIKFPLFDAAVEPYAVCGISTDITDRKRAQEQLGKAMADLQKSHEELKATQLQLVQAEKMQTIGRLAAGIAHEVKNPLAIASLGLEYLASMWPHKNRHVATTIKDMHEAIRRADSGLAEMMSFSTPQALDLREDDLNAVLEQSLQFVKHQLVRHHIRTARRLQKDLPPLLLDANKMKQVFVNIFINAVHAMPNGGMLRLKTYFQPAEFRLRVEGEQRNAEAARGGLVVAEVEDTGHGIPHDKLAKVFDPFFTTKPLGKGTGLGLSVAKQIVELHGGTIALSNRKEVGVRVVIKLKA